jgi:hypothetical protein
MNDSSPVRSEQSPQTESAAHNYAPRWWYPTATGVSTFALAAIVNAGFDVGVVSMFVVPVIAAVVSRHFATLELSAEGVTVNRRTVSWERLHLTKGRFGDSLTAASEGSGARRANILLPIYEREWRTGRIGEDVRRWAPGVIPQSDAVL